MYYYIPKDEDNIVVWFSCGAASAVAAKIVTEKYKNVRIVNTPVKEEDEDNRRFLKDVEEWIGQEIEIAQTKYTSIVEVFEERKFMSSPYGAPCTNEIKKKARKKWEDENEYTATVLGFTAEEGKRAERFAVGEGRLLYPVLVIENLTKGCCFSIIKKAGIELPRIYKQGYPNANCIGCVKASSPTYWNHVRKVHPDVFKERADQSDKIGAKLARYKGERIALSELPVDAYGAPMKDMDYECGIFC